MVIWFSEFMIVCFWSFDFYLLGCPVLVHRPCLVLTPQSLHKDEKCHFKYQDLHIFRVHLTSSSSCWSLQTLAWILLQLFSTAIVFLHLLSDSFQKIFNLELIQTQVYKYLPKSEGEISVLNSKIYITMGIWYPTLWNPVTFEIHHF